MKRKQPRPDFIAQLYRNEDYVRLFPAIGSDNNVNMAVADIHLFEQNSPSEADRAMSRIQIVRCGKWRKTPDGWWTAKVQFIS